VHDFNNFTSIKLRFTTAHEIENIIKSFKPEVHMDVMKSQLVYLK